MEMTEIENPEIIEKEIKEENSNVNNNSNNVSNSSSPKLLKQASIAVSTEKVNLQRKKTKIIASPKKDQQENSKEKSEIEINPFYKLLDLSDLLVNNQNNDKIMKNVIFSSLLYNIVSK